MDLAAHGVPFCSSQVFRTPTSGMGFEIRRMVAQTKQRDRQRATVTESEREVKQYTKALQPPTDPRSLNPKPCQATRNVPGHSETAPALRAERILRSSFCCLYAQEPASTLNPKPYTLNPKP